MPRIILQLNLTDRPKQRAFDGVGLPMPMIDLMECTSGLDLSL